MAWGVYGYRALLVVGTILSGTSNSLFTKYQDNQCVKYCDDPARLKDFNQPAIQTLQMFMGELSVFLVYYAIYLSSYAKKKRGYEAIESDEPTRTDTDDLSLIESLKLSVPSICDLCATTLMNIGLFYTPVSIYQMTRGSIVLFVAILSVLFLKRRITRLEWISLVTVTLGIAIVGYSGSRSSDESSATVTSPGESALVVFGISLVIAAVTFQAIQFVFEEYILAEKSIIPLKLVYIEGFYGFSIMLITLIVLNFIVGCLQPKSKFIDSPFNLSESLLQTFSSKQIVMSSVLIMISIASFNFCGISLTHELSATARSTIDTCRTLMVWLLALVMGWESFHLLQFIGFVILVFGTLCFNGVLRPEEWSWVPTFLKTPDSHERLIDVVDEQIERM